MKKIYHSNGFRTLIGLIKYRISISPPMSNITPQAAFNATVRALLLEAGVPPNIISESSALYLHACKAASHRTSNPGSVGYDVHQLALEALNSLGPSYVDETTQSDSDVIDERLEADEEYDMIGSPRLTCSFAEGVLNPMIVGRMPTRRGTRLGQRESKNVMKRRQSRRMSIMDATVVEGYDLNQGDLRMKGFGVGLPVTRRKKFALKLTDKHTPAPDATKPEGLFRSSRAFQTIDTKIEDVKKVESFFLELNQALQSARDELQIHIDEKANGQFKNLVQSMQNRVNVLWKLHQRRLDDIQRANRSRLADAIARIVADAERERRVLLEQIYRDREDKATENTEQLFQLKREKRKKVDEIAKLSHKAAKYHILLKKHCLTEALIDDERTRSENIVEHLQATVQLREDKITELTKHIEALEECVETQSWRNMPPGATLTTFLGNQAHPSSAAGNSTTILSSKATSLPPSRARTVGEQKDVRSSLNSRQGRKPAQLSRGGMLSAVGSTYILSALPSAEHIREPKALLSAVPSMDHLRDIKSARPRPEVRSGNSELTHGDRWANVEEEPEHAYPAFPTEGMTGFEGSALETDELFWEVANDVRQIYETKLGFLVEAHEAACRTIEEETENMGKEFESFFQRCFEQLASDPAVANRMRAAFPKLTKYAGRVYPVVLPPVIEKSDVAILCNLDNETPEVRIG
ncbi:hypothetical protein BJ742DRAFT_853883 [Cladochytrium replicatum]|nr:hypothetical protein BJ742DRAFT_853883 [Cladochytrium replicatum]